MDIAVAARKSPLSQAQFKEVQQELAVHHPEISLTACFVETIGDLDKTTSLKNLEKTDFFTKEIDALVLLGECRIGVHSAKDLPDPLPPGLVIAALTVGKDPSDALVMRPEESLESLPAGAKIATSSYRREVTVNALLKDCIFMDLRGTIEERLALLDTGEADGVVVAEAALIRLDLLHLNRVILPGETVPLQGQLAIVVREDDYQMHQLFQCLDSR
jgi:hydroxymethylbilane synthase